MSENIMDAAIVREILQQLDENGWDAGMQELKRRIETSCETNRCLAYRYFVGWMAGERGDHTEAMTQLRELEGHPAWQPWADVGRAFIFLRQRDNDAVQTALARAEAAFTPDTTLLRATVQHCRGAWLAHQDKPDVALAELQLALDGFGPEHFGTGRVLDTIGTAYAAKDNFYAAREFYELALALKIRFRDKLGEALTHGSLGRLYLDWGQLDLAHKHFHADLELAESNNEQDGVVVMCNWLGQVALRRKWGGRAGDWLDDGLRQCDPGKTIMRGFLHKDRALAHLLNGETALAEQQAAQAAALFSQANMGGGFPEGAAHLDYVRGCILRKKGDYAGAREALKKALNYFLATTQTVLATLAQLELGKVYQDDKSQALMSKTLRDALKWAEDSRRDWLVQEVEEVLIRLDPVAHWKRLYARVEGAAPDSQTIHTNSLQAGEHEVASVMFLDIEGSTEYGSTTDPSVVLLTVNQMWAEFAPLLEAHGVRVTDYQGDGFMALVRGAHHARRAVQAAWKMIQALEQFNEPRRVLHRYGVAEAKELRVRVGVATGEVFIGNIGTYRKVSLAALGTTTNLAARLQSAAEADWPCISRATYNDVREEFHFVAGEGREVSAKGLPAQQVWDVLGRA